MHTYVCICIYVCIYVFATMIGYVSSERALLTSLLKQSFFHKEPCRALAALSLYGSFAAETQKFRKPTRRCQLIAAVSEHNAC